MRTIKFYVAKEPPYYVAQCLNVDVSSFGDTMEEAIQNLKEAVELRLEDDGATEYQAVEELLVGEGLVNA